MQIYHFLPLLYNSEYFYDGQSHNAVPFLRLEPGKTSLKMLKCQPIRPLSTIKN